MAKYSYDRSFVHVELVDIEQKKDKVHFTYLLTDKTSGRTIKETRTMSAKSFKHYIKAYFNEKI